MVRSGAGSVGEGEVQLAEVRMHPPSLIFEVGQFFAALHKCKVGHKCRHGANRFSTLSPSLIETCTAAKSQYVCPLPARACEHSLGLGERLLPQRLPSLEHLLRVTSAMGMEGGGK